MHPTTQYSEAALLGGVVPGLRSPRRRGRAGLLDEQLFTLCFQVTLCSNTVQKYELALVVDVEGIGEEVLALLITARYHSPAPSSQSPRPRAGLPLQKAADLQTAHTAFIWSAVPDGRLNVIQMTTLSNSKCTFCGNKRRVCVCCSKNTGALSS